MRSLNSEAMDTMYITSAPSTAMVTMLAVRGRPPKVTHWSLNTAITPTTPPPTSARTGVLKRGCTLAK
ncbi:hypothetical protein FQZ97_1188510 [compost metagenome]